MGYSDGGLVTGFARGGYTGAGGKFQPAGVVHKDEFRFAKSLLANPVQKNFYGHLTRMGWKL